MVASSVYGTGVSPRFNMVENGGLIVLGVVEVAELNGVSNKDR